MKTNTDKLLLILTTMFVGALALVAGAISYAHMQNLALLHDQLGWKANAFPISVDGIEVVASFYILARRRAGRPAGWLPWVALLVGTIASLAANVAVGGRDPVGRVLAGWPAVSLLVSVKLLFSMFDHADGPGTVRDDQRTVPDGAPVPRTVPGTVRADVGPSGTTTGPGTDQSGPTAPGTTAAPDTAARPGPAADSRDVVHLMPAARAARDALAASGHALSRDRLADRMREDGSGVSNARAGLLVKVLRAEENVARLGPTPPASMSVDAGDPSTAQAS